jgi:hypothetical protein
VFLLVAHPHITATIAIATAMIAEVLYRVIKPNRFIYMPDMLLPPLANPHGTFTSRGSSGGYFHPQCFSPPTTLIHWLP